MSWSDDTRCLFCEGRLPLYRKITHGQFCSSAHRKAYWQEQERLAIERLHQTHSSLRSYRSPSQPLEFQQQDNLQETPQENATYSGQVPVTQVATYTQPETSLELDPVPSLDRNPHPIPDMGEPPMADSGFLSLVAPDFLGLDGGSPELVAADPFEYEITRQPVPPAPVWTGPGTNPLPEAPPVAAWFYLRQPKTSTKPASCAATLNCDVEFRHPRLGQPAAGMCAAGQVELPRWMAREVRRTARDSSLRVLDMEATPVTSVELDVRPHSDTLLELLDQQMPQPDRLHSLGAFAVQQPAGAFDAPPPVQVDTVAKTAFPATAVFAADYQPVSSKEMRKLAITLLPAKQTAASPTRISEIAVPPQTATCTMGRVAEFVHQVETAGLLSLRPDLSRPQAALVNQGADLLAFDLSAGVSSDITYPPLVAVSAEVGFQLFDRVLPLIFARKRRAAGSVARVEPISHSLPQAVEIYPVIPNSGLEPLNRKPPMDAIRETETTRGSMRYEDGLKKLEPAWAHATGFWHHAPRDLKLLLFAIPALLALVFHPGLPRIAFAAPKSSTGFTGQFTRVINDEWTNVRTTLENRAAVALDEDFRSGLDNWASPGGSTTEWSFDQTGFVRPGPLALYHPSVGLTDYQVQFLGLIDKKALSWVVRASDFENFYVVKLTTLKSGPMPVIGLTRYAVINGKSMDRHDVTIPLDARADTLYRVRMDVHGSEFAVEVQGQIADSWTEDRLPRGGVGFFTASGEASRLRWMQITHQYDMLGRLCAYLAPYDTTNGSWQP